MLELLAGPNRCYLYTLTAPSLLILGWGCGWSDSSLPPSTSNAGSASVTETGLCVKKSHAYCPEQPARSWIQTAKLQCETGSPTVFGECVGVSGDRLVVDATRIESASQECYLYVFDRGRDGSWRQTARVPLADGAGNVNALAVAGDHVIVSVNGWDGPGGVYILELQPDGSWQQTAQLSDEDFVHSVALLEGRAVFGAIGQYPSSVYIFDRQVDGSWRQVAQLTETEDGGPSRFGTSLSLTNDRVLIGDEPTSEAGPVAFVFERQNDGSWVETEQLIPRDRSVYGLHGVTVSLSETRALVGTNCYRSNSLFTSGVAYVFERQVDGSWHETAELVPEGVSEGDFMINVSLSGDQAVIGAYRYTNFSQWSDAASIFEFQPDGTWQQTARLTADDAVQLIDGDTVEKYMFAGSVNIAGDRVVLGAPCDWEKNSSHPGAVYVFER